jgi:CubicO group peptidase (beta-lactamase class C family)
MGFSRRSLLLATAGTFVAGCTLPEIRDPLDKRLARHMDERGITAASYAVVDDGGLVLADGLGATAATLGDPTTPATLFQAASISKSVTAAVVLALVAEGRLDLDRDVQGYLTRWRLPASELTRDRPVTLRRLLANTGGTDVHGYRGYPLGATLPDTVAILSGAAPSNSPPVQIVATPGSRWSYSGGGYEIAQAAVEDVTGENFAVAASRLVLGPYGMGRATFAQPLPPETEILAARGYAADGHAFAGGGHIYPELAAAGLWCSPSDLGQFACGLIDSYGGRAGAPLPRALADTMMQPVDGQRYGLGGGLLRTADGTPVFVKEGANAGFRSWLTILPAEGKAAVIMTNSDRGNELFAPFFAEVGSIWGWPALAQPLFGVG